MEGNPLNWEKRGMRRRRREGKESSRNEKSFGAKRRTLAVVLWAFGGGAATPRCRAFKC